jgi:hypothetical protein
MTDDAEQYVKAWVAKESLQVDTTVPSPSPAKEVVITTYPSVLRQDNK